MTLDELLRVLPATGLDTVAFPRRLLGAFRRKSITFCTGATDETTVVYWFQSASFTLDLRLPDAGSTAVADRQGWVGDTVWDPVAQQMSWEVARSYQQRNQWPEPATFHFIGNSVLEFAPSGAYVEDWRQQSTQGPYLGLRLVGVRGPGSDEEVPVDGAFVLAGEHAAFARSRPPEIERALSTAHCIDNAIAMGLVTPAQVESYEVSVALAGRTITHTTQPQRAGATIVTGDFTMADDGSVILREDTGEQLRFLIDVYVPEFLFSVRTPCTRDAATWLQAEKVHLARHAVVAL